MPPNEKEMPMAPAAARPLSPCVQVCEPVGRICVGCHRTIDEIRAWPRMTQAERATRMRELDGTLSTHDCPECGERAHCAVAAGEAAENCWCMDLQRRELRAATETCLCRSCLARRPLLDS